MADLKFVVTFIYDHAVSVFTKTLIEREWASGYNRCCSIVNEKLEAWNAEYGPVEDETDYEAFMTKKYRHAIEKAGIATKRLVFTADNKRGACEIVGRIRGTTNKVRMRLKETE